MFYIVEFCQGARCRKETDRVCHAEVDADGAVGLVGGHGGDVRVVAPSEVLGAHVRRLLSGLPVAVGEFRSRGQGEPPALVGVRVEDVPHLRAGERTEPGREDAIALVGVRRNIQIRRKAQPVADLLHGLRAHAAAFERVEERLLDLEDALMGEDDVVLRRPPDEVVDLDELGRAVALRPEVDLPGVVVAGRDAVELRKADVG